MDHGRFQLLLIIAAAPLHASALRFAPACVHDPARLIVQPIVRTSVAIARLGGDFRSRREEDLDEADYARKVAEAEVALAAAAEARQRLTGRNRPKLRRARLSRSDAGTLVVDVPAAGLGTSALMGGAFSAAWFSAIVPATFASGGAPILFMLPFWAAGGVVAKTAVVDPFVSTQLTIGRFAWSLRSTLYGGVVLKEQDGPTDQLSGVAAEVVAYVNGVPQCELQLYTDSGTTSFGLSLTLEELEVLEAEINEHLLELQALPQEGP